MDETVHNTGPAHEHPANTCPCYWYLSGLVCRQAFCCRFRGLKGFGELRELRGLGGVGVQGLGLVGVGVLGG